MISIFNSTLKKHGFSNISIWDRWNYISLFLFHRLFPIEINQTSNKYLLELNKTRSKGHTKCMLRGVARGDTIMCPQIMHLSVWYFLHKRRHYRDHTGIYKQNQIKGCLCKLFVSKRIENSNILFDIWKQVQVWNNLIHP